MIITTTATGSEVRLPTGEVVVGEPHDTDEYRATAERLGYGSDTLRMCKDHDPLHAGLCDWMKLPTSYSLSIAAGRILSDEEKMYAVLEEDAVAAVQRFARAVGRL